MEEPLSLTSENGGIVITDAVHGQFEIIQSSEQTLGLIPGTYPYDIWVEYQSSPLIETQYVTGTFSVIPSITEVP